MTLTTQRDVEAIEAVQLDGGPLGLETEMNQLKEFNQINKDLLIECEKILQKEAQEDARLLSQYGNRWIRPQSATLTKNFQDQIISFRSKLEQAAKVDARIERIIQDNLALMSILSIKPVSNLITSSKFENILMYLSVSTDRVGSSDYWEAYHVYGWE